MYSLCCPISFSLIVDILSFQRRYIPWISSIYFVEVQVSFTLDLDQMEGIETRILALLIGMKYNPGINLLNEHLSVCFC